MRVQPVAALLLSFVTAACGLTSDEEMSSDGDEDDDDSYEPWAPKADNQNGLGGTLTFSGACATGARTTIGAVGDVLLHGALQQQGMARGFESLWAPIADLIAKPDVMYANFEGPSASGVDARGRAVRDPGLVFDNVVYSSYPQFNYHNDLVVDMIASGFDVVSTANNHTMDRRELGADKTIEAMRAAGMPYTGSRRRDEPTAPWHVTTDENGFRLAWLACTYGTNGLPDPKQQVLGCWEDETEIKALIGTLRPSVDAVIVTPHWGDEYVANPNRKQRDLAKRFVDAGALLVIGSHPHVLQPWETITAADGRQGFVIYSLGNFVSGQTHLARRSSMLLYVGLTRSAQGVVVNGVSYVPLAMTTRSGVRGIEAIDRSGGNADSRRMTVNMFGETSVQAVDGPIVTARCP
jgi:hypothetical protein